MMRGACLYMVLGAVVLAGMQAPPPNVDAKIQKEFQKRLDDYVKLRNTARENVHKLKPTKSAEAIEYHEAGLAHAIRELRHGVGQGQIFTPEITTEFRRLIGMTMQGEEAVRIRESLSRAEPVHLKSLRINHRYPEGVPLQSTPPTLLLNLPKLPQALEYRVVGSALVLLDVEANLVVDFIPDVIPEVSHAR